MMKKILILALATFIAQCATIKNTPIVREIELQGHRGARGLSPENTWPAFETALKHEMNVLELDTVVTADKELVIHHDAETNSALCTDATGKPVERKPIKTLTLAELKQFDCGSIKNEKFPEQQVVPGTKLISLDEFFALVKAAEKKDPRYAKLTFNIETKFPGDAQASAEELSEFANIIVKKIKTAQMDKRTTVQSFAVEVLPLVKKAAPEIRTAALFVPTKWQGLRMYAGLGDGIRHAILAKGVEVKADIISPYGLYVNAEFVKIAHEKKMAVIPWTINEESYMLDLLNLGVDGIISDYPDRLKSAYAKFKNQPAKK